jgi:hypothetical protein
LLSIGELKKRSSAITLLELDLTKGGNKNLALSIDDKLGAVSGSGEECLVRVFQSTQDPGEKFPSVRRFEEFRSPCFCHRVPVAPFNARESF